MTRLAQLNHVEHARLKVQSGFHASYGDAVMSAPVFPSEIRSAQAYYPIVFAPDEAGGFRPMALFGLEQNSNLFLTGSAWDAAYVPLSIRMKPFLIGRNTQTGDLKVHIDLDHPRVSETEGDALFDAAGQPAPALEAASALLAEVHEGEQTVRPFSALLEELDLIEPFSLDVKLDDGAQGRLAGYSTINEEKLQNLSGADLARLQGTGSLLPVHMMLASMSQFVGLIERRNRLGGGVAA